MNILQAISDPQVFGGHFKDHDTWSAWFAFLAALFGLPMTPDQLAVYQQCTGRQLAPSERATEGWLVIGRRGGKSFMLAVIAVFLACFRDWRPHLQAGEVGTVMIIAADRKQARVIMRYVKGLLNSVPMLQQLIEAERQESIDLSNRITIEVHTASFRTVRGYTIVAALLDEVAFWPTDETSFSPDFEVLTAIKPAKATVPGSMLLCASSPYAKKGSLFEAFDRNFGKDGSTLVWQADTRTMNPTVSATFIEDEYEKDPVSAAAEYGAEFRTDIESYISREAVEACVEWSAHERGPMSGIRYTAFVDPSGGSVDSMTLCVAHKEGDVGVLDCVREVKAPFSPEAVVHEFADTLKTYGIKQITGDKYAGEWCREAFRRHGITYVPSADPKGTIYLNLLPLINSGSVRLLASRRLVNQLLGLERNTARGGKDSIDHARGGHDDVANAAAGALLSAMAKKPRARIGTVDPHGRVHWKPDEDNKRRLRVTYVSEQEALRQKAEGNW